MSILLSHPSRPGVVTASLGSQHGLSHRPPGLSQTAVKHGSHCSCYEVAPGLLQPTANLGLHRSPSNRPHNQHSGGHLQTTTEYHLVNSTGRTPKRRSWQVPDPAGADAAPCSHTPRTAACAITGRHTQPTQDTLLKHPAQVIRKAVPWAHRTPST